MRRRNFVFILLGVILLSLAVAIVSSNRAEDNEAEEYASEILRQIDNSVELPDITEVPLDEEPELEEETVFTVDGHTYIGTIEIPRFDIRLPVMSDWSFPNLRLAPCRYIGAVSSKDLIIAAHNYRSHFGRLRELQADDDVIFRDGLDREHLYKVAAIETVEGTDIEGMEAGDWDLTLFTCTLDSKSRVTVRCTEVTPEPENVSGK